MKKIFKIFIFIDIILIFILIFIYTPQLKKIFQNDEVNNYINYVFYNNFIEDTFEDNNLIQNSNHNKDNILVESNNQQKYDNVIEQMLLNHSEDENYAVIYTQVASYDAYIVAIYDPANVHLITIPNFKTANNNGRKSILKMAEENNAEVAINASGHVVIDGLGYDIPKGYVIKNSEIIWKANNNKANLIGFTNDNKLLLVNATGEEAINMGMRDAVEFGPFLIVDGKVIDNAASAGGYNMAARTAIAQRKDGIVLFLVTEGRHSAGPNMLEITDLLLKFGAYNAANLDGGTSTQLVVKNELINTSINIFGKVNSKGNGVVTGWGFLENKKAN